MPSIMRVNLVTLPLYKLSELQWTGDEHCFLACEALEV